MKPIAMFPEKESQELLREFMPILDEEVDDISKSGVNVNISGEERKVICVKSHMTLCDGKMITNFMQLGGSYCTMCTSEQKDCHGQNIVKEGFLISRSVDSVKDLAIALADLEKGEVQRQRGDYNVRQGVIGQPLTLADLCSNIPVCHNKIEYLNALLI